MHTTAEEKKTVSVANDNILFKYLVYQSNCKRYATNSQQSVQFGSVWVICLFHSCIEFNTLNERIEKSNIYEKNTNYFNRIEEVQTVPYTKSKREQIEQEKKTIIFQVNDIILPLICKTFNKLFVVIFCRVYCFIFSQCDKWIWCQFNQNGQVNICECCAVFLGHKIQMFWWEASTFFFFCFNGSMS